MPRLCWTDHVLITHLLNWQAHSSQTSPPGIVIGIETRFCQIMFWSHICHTWWPPKGQTSPPGIVTGRRTRSCYIMFWSHICQTWRPYRRQTLLQIFVLSQVEELGLWDHFVINDLSYLATSQKTSPSSNICVITGGRIRSVRPSPGHDKVTPSNQIPIYLLQWEMPCFAERWVRNIPAHYPISSKLLYSENLLNKAIEAFFCAMYLNIGMKTGNCHIFNKLDNLFVSSSGLGGVLQTLTPFSKPWALSIASEPFKARSSEEDESVDSFIRRRLGPEVSAVTCM